MTENVKIGFSILGVKKSTKEVEKLNENLERVKEEVGAVNERLDAQQQVFEQISIAGGVILAPLIASTSKYIEAAGKSEKTSAAWLKQTERLQQSQVELGRKASEALLPLLTLLADITEKVSNVDSRIITAAVGVGGILTFVGAMGIFATQVQRFNAAVRLFGAFSKQSGMGAGLARVGVGATALGVGANLGVEVSKALGKIFDDENLKTASLEKALENFKKLIFIGAYGIVEVAELIVNAFNNLANGVSAVKKELEKVLTGMVYAFEMTKITVLEIAQDFAGVLGLDDVGLKSDEANRQREDLKVRRQEEIKNIDDPNREQRNILKDKRNELTGGIAFYERTIEQFLSDTEMTQKQINRLERLGIKNVEDAKNKISEYTTELEKVNSEIDSLSQVKSDVDFSGVLQDFGELIGVLESTGDEAKKTANAFSKEMLDAFEIFQDEQKDLTDEFYQERNTSISSFNEDLEKEEKSFYEQRKKTLKDFENSILKQEKDFNEKQKKDRNKFNQQQNKDYQDFVTQQQKDRKSFREEEVKAEEQYRKDRIRALEDFQDNLLNAAGSLDALTVVNLTKSFAKDKKRREEDFQNQQKERKDNFEEQQQEIKQEFQQRRRLQQQEFEQERRLQKQEFEQRISESRLKFEIQREEELQQFNQIRQLRREEFSQQLKGEQTQFNKLKQQRKQKFVEELNEARGFNTRSEQETARHYSMLNKQLLRFVQNNQKIMQSTNRMGGIQIPSFANGGIMPNDGLAMLHKGERVLNLQQQKMFNTTSNRSSNSSIVINVNGSGSPEKTAQNIKMQLDSYFKGIIG